MATLDARTSAVLDSIDTIVSFAPSHADEITTSLDKRSAALRHEAAGASAQASADRNYLNNRDTLDEQLIAAIRDANNKVQSDGDKKKLADAVGSLFGINGEEAGAILADLRNKDHANKDGTNPVSRFFGAKTDAGREEDTLYARMGALLKPITDDAVTNIAAAQQSNPFAADLKRPDKAQETLTDKELLGQLADATKTLDAKTRDAVTAIAIAEPDHAKDIIKKTRAFTEDMADHGGVPSSAKANDLAKALTQASVDYAKTHGGSDATVATSIAAITGADSTLATIDAAAFGSKEAAKAGRPPMNNNEGPEDPATAARRSEGERLQQANEATLVVQLTQGLTHPGAATVGQAQTKPPRVERVGTPVPPRNAAAVLAAATLPAPEAAAPQLRPDGTAKITQIDVANGTTIETKLVQTALKRAGQNIGDFGDKQDGVDNDAGKATWAAIDNVRKMRHMGNLGSRKLDDSDIALLTDPKALLALKQEQERVTVARAQATGIGADNRADAAHDIRVVKTAAVAPAAAAGAVAMGSVSTLPIDADVANNMNPKFIEAAFKAVVDPKGQGSDKDRALKYLQDQGMAKDGKIGGTEVNFAIKQASELHDKQHPSDKNKTLVAKVESLTGISGLTMIAHKETPAAVPTAIAPKKDGELNVHLAGDVRKDLTDAQWRKLAALTHAKTDGKTLEITADRAGEMITAARAQFERQTSRVVKSVPEMLAAYKIGADGSVALSTEKPVDQNTAYALLAKATGHEELAKGGDNARKAMSTFQKQNGLEETSVADATTMQKLATKALEAQTATEMAKERERDRERANQSEFAGLIAPQQTPGGKPRTNETLVASK